MQRKTLHATPAFSGTFSGRNVQFCNRPTSFHYYTYTYYICHQKTHNTSAAVGQTNEVVAFSSSWNETVGLSDVSHVREQWLTDWLTIRQAPPQLTAFVFISSDRVCVVSLFTTWFIARELIEIDTSCEQEGRDSERRHHQITV